MLTSNNVTLMSTATGCPESSFSTTKTIHAHQNTIKKKIFAHVTNSSDNKSIPNPTKIAHRSSCSTDTIDTSTACLTTFLRMNVDIHASCIDETETKKNHQNYTYARPLTKALAMSYTHLLQPTQTMQSRLSSFHNFITLT